MRASLLILAAVYAGAIVAQPAGVFWSPDEGGKFIQMLNMRWEEGLRYSIAYPGGWLDPTYRFVSFPPVFGVVIGEDLYLAWPVSLALATWLPYALLGHLGLYLIPALSGLGVCVVSGAIAKRLRVAGAPFVPLLLGLATPIFFYSILFWEHTLSVLLALLAFYLLLEEHEGCRWRTLVSGLLMGLAALFRAELLLLAAASVVAIVLCRTAKKQAGITIGLLILGVAIPMILQVGFNYATIGQATAPNIGPYSRILRPPIVAMEGLPFLAQVVAGHDIGRPFTLAWSLVTGSICLGVAGLVRRGRIRLAMAALGLAALGVGATGFLFWPESYRSVHGLLVAAPFIGFSALGLRTALLDKGFAQRFTFVATILYVPAWVAAMGIFSPWGVEGAGLEWGPRFVLVGYPLLTVLSLASLEHLRQETDSQIVRLAIAVAFLLLVGIGAGMEVRGYRTLIEDKAGIKAASQSIDSMVERQIATDLWWIQLALADQYGRKEFFNVRDNRELYDWASVARGKGVSSFWFASLRQLDPLRPSPGNPPLVLKVGDVKRGGPIVFTHLTIVPSPGLR